MATVFKKDIYKRDFEKSKYTSPTDFFREVYNWNDKKLKSGYFHALTKGWRKTKSMIVAEKATKQVLRELEKNDKSIELPKVKDMAELKTKAKEYVLKTYELMFSTVDLVRDDLENGRVKSVEVLKTFKGLQEFAGLFQDLSDNLKIKNNNSMNDGHTEGRGESSDSQSQVHFHVHHIEGHNKGRVVSVEGDLKPL